jgi:hypothetical protein
MATQGSEYSLRGRDEIVKPALGKYSAPDGIKVFRHIDWRTNRLQLRFAVPVSRVERKVVSKHGWKYIVSLCHKLREL